MNAQFLGEQEVQENIRRLWAAHSALPFFGRLRRCVKFYRMYCLRKAAERKQEEGHLRNQLEKKVTELQEDPGSVMKQAGLASVVDQLKELESKKVVGQQFRQRLLWKKDGDRGSKTFFNAHKEKSVATHITSLEDSYGQAHSSQEALSRICKDYYSKLYSVRESFPATSGTGTQAIHNMPDKTPESQKARLKAPMQLSELYAALMEMRTGKSLGPDGIVLEFYRKFWDLLGEDYLQMINSSLQSGRFPPGVTQGMLALLHKGGIRQMLTNWRPITLLNISYKIYAKALQMRLQPVLMDIISPDQSAFLPMRFILDNLLLTQETLAWAEYSKQPLVFLKLDFSKAYDMVDWPFLFQAMTAIGLPQEFNDMVRLLFQDASATVKVNGTPSEAFQIKRGVRQACPLAPYLFLVVSEVLNVMVMNDLREGRVRGIQLPVEDRQQIMAQYADDTSFILYGEESSVRNLIYTLKTFCLATGLVLNWTKSCGY
jgi:hypothetical protein